MNLKQACVMVVDDRAVRRILITGNLRGLGVQQVHAFADGEAVLAALAATRPDVILTDVQMQPMDGMSLVRAIRALPDPALAATRIVFLSGDDSDGTRHQPARPWMSVASWPSRRRPPRWRACWNAC
jgi:two-component system, chemotaxis family, chemotaxis protein CheY